LKPEWVKSICIEEVIVEEVDILKRIRKLEARDVSYQLIPMTKIKPTVPFISD